MEIKYDNLLNELIDIQKHSNKYLNANVIATKLKFLGVYTKDLKSLAKKYKDYDFIDFKFDEYYEINFIYAYSNLLRLKNNVDAQVDFILNNENLFECWAIVDSTACLIKNFDINICKKFLTSSNEFVIRFAYVILLSKVRKEMMINEAFNIIIKDKRYYIVMAEGWLISECLISSFEKSFSLLKSSTMSEKIKYIAIQKAIDSYRLDDEKKNTLRLYRNILKGEHR